MRENRKSGTHRVPTPRDLYWFNDCKTNKLAQCDMSIKQSNKCAELTAERERMCHSVTTGHEESLWNEGEEHDQQKSEGRRDHHEVKRPLKLLSHPCFVLES